MTMNMNVQHWAVTARYAAPGSRPGNRRHPPPEDFRRRTVVGPPTPMTVEAVLDLLDVPENVRVKIRANAVVQNFVEGRLVPDQPYPHNTLGGHYVDVASDSEQFVEWDLTFVFVTRMIDDLGTMKVSRNACCGNVGTHGEGRREYCSTCGADLGERTFP
jgi:hypothetical protein